jgi:hypothetical protein
MNQPKTNQSRFLNIKKAAVRSRLIISIEVLRICYAEGAAGV